MKVTKRCISLLLALTLILSVLPMGMFTATAQEIATDAVITVKNSYGKGGATVAVDVVIQNNPGILGMTLTLTYDESALTLTGVTNGDAMSALTFTAPKEFKSGVNLPWDAESISEEDIKDGVIATLTFEISETAQLNSRVPVEVSYDAGAIVDNDLNSLSVLLSPGYIQVLDYTPGDLNDNGIVDTTDVVLLRRYIAGGYGVTIVENAADVNDDGKRNTTDAVLIRRYIAGGYGVELLPVSPKCDHTMEHTPYKAPTCTEEGNVAYWYCSTCKKYFNDEVGTKELTEEQLVIPAPGHTVVIDEAVPPTPTTEGLTEGSHCSVCGEVFVAQETILPTVAVTHEIIYDVANGDPYLVKLINQGTLVNSNAAYYEEGVGLTLKNLSVPGYRFLGWYDLAENGTLIKSIPADATEDYELYAYWSKIEYTVQYKSSLFVDRAQDTYTVDTGLVLPTPKLSNYMFIGWSDENGELLTEGTIPVGTTGNLILDANWTSERNKTWTKPVIEDPIIEIDEENGVILFAYEIGEIQNVPLYTIKDFGYISGEGVTREEEAEYTVTITDSMMKAYAKSVAMATTESSNWTLASTWNTSTSVNEEWCQENGKNIEETDTVAKSDSQNWNISNSKSGSTETTTQTTNQDGWKNEVKVNSNSSQTDSESSTTKTTDNEAWNVDAKLTYTPKSYSFGIDIFEVGGLNASTSGGWGGEIGGGYEHSWGEETTESEEHSSTSSSGFELGGTHDKSTLTTNGTTSTASWNDTSSYGGSSTNSTTVSNSTALSEKISKAYGYGSSYAAGGESGTSQGLSASQSDSESYSSSVTYSTETSERVTSKWTTQATKPGYHRWVVAGTAHVFAVVGYDMTENAYFVYTYSVMDDETHEFEDYSYTSADYNDQENGVISFEIPYEVAEYVSEMTSYSDGLKVNQETGIIEEYAGDDTCVVIPEYWNVGNGEVVKVTGIGASAFKGNEEICAVVLSDFITEIPAYAFQGCSSLKEIVGGSITKIGAYAFDGCTDAEDLGVRSSVEYLGEKAFGGVQRIIVNAANKDVLMAAVDSGAEQIIVTLEYIEGGEQELKGLEMTIPKGTKFFELNGNQKTYEDFSLTSDADITVLNKIHFSGVSKIPVNIGSSEVVLNQSSITASGIGLVLRADICHLGLQGNITVQSANGNAMLAKDLGLYEINKNVVGKLIVKDKLLQCGTTEGTSYLSYVQHEEIDLAAFDNLLNSYTLYFDANGGSCSEESRIVANSTKIGTLPIPEREHYTFMGWYLEDGTMVTEDTVFSTGMDVTVYAKWTPVPYTVSWNTGAGYTISVSRTSSPNAGAATGALNNGDAVYYGDVLNIAYSAATGYTLNSKGSTSVTVAGNVTASTIYATAYVNSYTVSWNTGTGYTIAVNRTRSPLQGASTGPLGNNAKIYYGDVLSVTYAASTGYSLSSKGATAVTVTGNVTSATIYAAAKANSYTYNIVYKSSNDTALGSSTATYNYGTTNTISPKSFPGYNTPPSQSVPWDSTAAKTITFTYEPTSVPATTKAGNIYVETASKLMYDVTIEYRNRTANSVQIRVTWTATLSGSGAYNKYGQNFRASVGSVGTGNVSLSSYGTWSSASSSARSVTKSSAWITVSLGTTNATSVSMYVYYFQTNSNGTDVTSYGASSMSDTWTIPLPAY